ncbi:helix-turn-helix domain-containing protein [Paraburkholderia sp. 1N]|uniref:Helix-turn-helix domain-containing protein n=1 Tax=Paraburkholderia solitsugae TaxID=2675748 RepID=A0ABX2C4T9_9BURK|nr:helix-turn-helix domain-containing protein [Paraburkholderia solitsugae]NPT47636.1 helix-turn-helix domain-containing protein [Paraburkholderia solitsugae]
MRSTFDLEDLPLSERYEYWRDVSETLHVPVSVSCDETETFTAKWDGRPLGRLFVGSAFLSEAQRVSRTSYHIGRSAADPVGIWMPLTGGIHLRQDGKDALIGPGQLAIVDPARPYEELTLRNCNFLWMHVPREDIVARIGSTQKVTGLTHSVDQPHARLAIEFVRSLSTVWDELSSPQSEQVAAHVLSLLGLAFNAYTDSPAITNDTDSSELLLWIRLFIDERVADRGLSAETVAAALGLSTQEVRRLTAQAGPGFQDYVQARRLTRSFRMLSDPRFAAHSVNDISNMVGWLHIDCFRKAFEAAYDISPDDYRLRKGSTDC